MSSAYSRIRLSSAWLLHLSFLYYTVNSFWCDLYFHTSFSSTLHSSSPFHSFRMSLPSVWHQLPSLFNAAYMGLRSIIFQSFSLQHHPLTSRHCQLSSSKPSTIELFQHLIIIWYSTSTPVVIFLPSTFSSCHTTLGYHHLSILTFLASARTPPYNFYYQHSPFSIYSVWPHLSSGYRGMLLTFKSSPLNSFFPFSLLTISCFIIHSTPSRLDNFPHYNYTVNLYSYTEFLICHREHLSNLHLLYLLLVYCLFTLSCLFLSNIMLSHSTPLLWFLAYYMNVITIFNW